jgi:hypothetical protein
LVKLLFTGRAHIIGVFTTSGGSAMPALSHSFEKKLKQRMSGLDKVAPERIETQSQNAMLCALLNVSQEDLARANIGASRQQRIQVVKELALGAAPQAVHYLVRLVTGREDGAPHSVRRLAAVDLINLAGAGNSQEQSSNSLNDMSIDQLQAFITASQQKLSILAAGLNATDIEPLDK